MGNNYANMDLESSTATFDFGTEEPTVTWFAVIGPDGVIMQLYTTKMLAIEEIKEQPFF